MMTMLAQMDPVLLSTFMAASLALYLTPGADMMFIIASGIAGGPRVGVAATVGVSLGILLHVVLAAAGLAVLIATSPAALVMIRYLGAAYLLFLAVQAWRDADREPDTQGRTDTWRALRRGLVTNIMNPKIILFMLAFLPQFTDPAIGPVSQQIAILGLMFAAGGFIVAALIGIFAGYLGTRLKRATGVLNKLTSIIFGGLAAKLVFD